MAIQRNAFSARFDEIFGTADELVSEGVASLAELPGQPGRNKTMCTYHGGVQLPRGSQVAKGQTSILAGYRQISRRGKSRYRVLLYVGGAEAARREAQCGAEEDQNLRAATETVVGAGAPSHWAGRVGIYFAAQVVRRQHLRVVQR